MKRLFVLLTTLLVLGATHVAARSYLLIGDTGEDAITLLGTPTGSLVLDEANGRATIQFGKCTVEINHDRVIRWRNFPVPKRDAYPALTLGATRDAVIAAWGPTPAATFHGKATHDGPLVGDEEWTYKKSTLIMSNGVLAGWDNLDGFKLSTGKAGTGPVPAHLGATPAEVLRAAIPPDALHPLNTKGNAEWRYGTAMLLFRGGKVGGWVNYNKELTVTMDAGAPSIAQPVVNGSKADLFGNMNVPAVYVPGGGSTLWLYPTNAFIVNDAGVITEVGTRRFQTKLATGNLADLLDWVLGLTRLDDTSSILAEVVKPDTQYATFLTTIEDSKNYAEFKKSNRKEILDAYQNDPRYSTEFRSGLVAAWKCETTTQVKALMNQPNDVRLGAKVVYDAYEKALGLEFQDYLTKNLRTIPKLVDKTQTDAQATLTGMGLVADIVTYKDAKERGVTSNVPPAGASVKAGATVVVYVAVE